MNLTENASVKYEQFSGDSGLWANTGNKREEMNNTIGT